MKKINFLDLFNDFIHNKNNILFNTLTVFVLTGVITFLIAGKSFGSFKIPDVGDIITEDIVVSKDIRYIDRQATERNEEIIKKTTPPIYVKDNAISKDRLQLLEFLLNKIESNISYSELTKFIENDIIAITTGEYDVIKNIVSNNPEFKEEYLKLLSEQYEKGIILLSNDEKRQIEISGILVGQYDGNKLIETLYSLEEITDYELSRQKCAQIIETEFADYNLLEKKILVNIFTAFLTPTILHDSSLSNLQLQRKLEGKEVYKKIRKGQIIARKGDLVTDQNVYKIKAVYENSTKKLSFTSLIFYSLFAVVFLLFSIKFILLYDDTFFDDIKNNLFIGFILLVYIFYILAPLYIGSQQNSLFYGHIIPIASLTLTFVFLYSKVTAAILTVLFSVLFLILSEFNYHGFIFIFFSGICSIFSVSQVKTRINLLIAGVFLQFFNLCITGLFIVIGDYETSKIVYYLILAAVNGLLSPVLAIGIIALGEQILNSPTLFKLQELANPSSPLMKELFDSAVGTYNHSLLVANLAESAAHEIGVDSILARVGGYYHDIGKIGNAEYFIENQGDFNVHTQLKPSISAAIIKSHVKKGVEKGRKAKLPKKVIDIISQHHGSSLIKYFYHQALNNSNQDKEEIQRDMFQYKEDNPKFPESAIVLLADQVEAAARTLKKASMSSVEKLIEAIIDNNFQDGILDDSGLTLKDLTKIKKIFVKLILGMYHSRIEYPEKNKNLKDKNNDKEQNGSNISTGKDEDENRTDIGRNFDNEHSSN